MKITYITPRTCWGPAVLEDCLLEVSGRSTDMDYEENTDIGWTY